MASLPRVRWYRAIGPMVARVTFEVLPFQLKPHGPINVCLSFPTSTSCTVFCFLFVLSSLLADGAIQRATTLPIPRVVSGHPSLSYEFISRCRYSTPTRRQWGYLKRQHSNITRATMGPMALCRRTLGGDAIERNFCVRLNRWRIFGADTTPWWKAGGKRGAREYAPDSAWAWRMSGDRKISCFPCSADHKQG